MKRKNPVRQTVAVSVGLLAVLFALPFFTIPSFRAALLPDSSAADETEELPEIDPFVPGAQDGSVTLRVLNNGQVEEMTAGEYLIGVLRAEMPASFEEEALKAQAVAARTYTYYKIQTGSSHGDTADICTDYTCCQAYLAEDRALEKWGADAAAYEAKIEAAVKETDGQVLLYDGAPILAVFHSSSAGETRTAGTVWQNDLPYLQAVSSPENADAIPNYYSRAAFTAEEFCSKVLERLPDADLSGPMSGWLKNAETDSSGSVVKLDVGGVRIKGATLRSILGLRSACFEWEVQDDKLVFFVTGYGHGVGMSQYGAEEMALEGADYAEILTHYYTGVTLGSYVPPSLQTD